MLNLLISQSDRKYIIYFATTACVDYFYKIISSIPQFASWAIVSLHGKMDTKRREAVFEKFKTAATVKSVMLCTDIAARGLDIPDVDWVIQFDPPQDPKAFAHRCGRTARQGKDGAALAFLTKEEDAYLGMMIS